ncbi:YbaB/EbfC family nucleoid-associated protein [Nocardia sp. CDC160]|uniref:YbaB/EbfC family nucleoid-associated protein n=1 Tax=Nocardia sp. CDC160 TaxID=3112166 RepID=UPI002DBF5ADF|nr:YbaB/EbfC family nucleoid-associated protein [Nocardia sp. CDC160]MEC3920338.1 YbaB/EbfC family nucleoid-associated protein [Nocardia sp. CDC160]
MNDAEKAQLAELLETTRRQMSVVDDLRHRRSLLTATASAGDGRVHITVNADGQPIRTEFGDDIGDLTFDEIAEAVTEAAQRAAADVTHRGQQLMEPVLQNNLHLPKLSDIVAGAPDLDHMIDTSGQQARQIPGAATDPLW